MNKVEIIHDKEFLKILLNGEWIKGVTNFSIRKNSAQDSTELILVLDVAELNEEY